MKERTRRLLGWSQGERHGPLEIRLELTYRCNLACLSCFRRGVEYDHGAEVDHGRVVEIVRQSAALDVRKWHLTGGGEPLIRKDTAMAVMELVKAQDQMGQITTNGTLFDETMVRRLVEIGFDEVQFSIDGPDRKTHDYLRNRAGAFMADVRNLKLFMKWKRKLGKDRPHVIMSTVVSSGNFDRLSRLVKFARRHGVVNIIAEPVTIHSELTREVALTEAQRRILPEHLMAAQELADSLGIRTNMAHLVDPRYVVKDSITQVICEDVADESGTRRDPAGGSGRSGEAGGEMGGGMECVAADRGDRDSAAAGLVPEAASDAGGGEHRDHDRMPAEDAFFRSPCYAPWLDMWIMPDGLIGPCRVVAGDCKYRCDNIKQADLADIWYGDRFQWFRRVMTGSIPEDCRRCCANQVLTVKEIQREVRETLESMHDKAAP